jgi:hypothetical protein
MRNRAEVERAWKAHLRRPFPKECVGREIDGVCLTSCDTFLAGCVSHVVAGGVLDTARALTVAGVSAEIKRALPHLSGAAHEYFASLVDLGESLNVNANAR